MPWKKPQLGGEDGDIDLTDEIPLDISTFDEARRYSAPLPSDSSYFLPDILIFSVASTIASFGWYELPSHLLFVSNAIKKLFLLSDKLSFLKVMSH